MYSKLLNIQSELKAPKSQTNNFGKYKYRNAEDILEAIKPLLKKENVALTLTDELQQIGDRYYVKATAKLFDDKDNIEVTAYAREEESKKGMDGSQVTGASSSYARKYALNGLFCIDDTKDSDTTNITPNEIGQVEIIELFEAGKEAGYSKAQVLNHMAMKFKKETPDLLTHEEFKKMVDGYKTKKGERSNE
jgi:hypothetical protein